MKKRATKPQKLHHFFGVSCLRGSGSYFWTRNGIADQPSPIPTTSSIIWNLDIDCKPGFVLTILPGTDCQFKIGEAMAPSAPSATLLSSVFDSSDPNSQGAAENVLRIQTNNSSVITPELDMASGPSKILELRKRWEICFTPGGNARIDWLTGELTVVVKTAASMAQTPRSVKRRL
jgi:hypothetical protein